MVISYFYLFCRTARGIFIEFSFIWGQHRLQLVNFLSFAVALCLYDQLSLSLSDVFASLVNKDYVAACIK